MGQMMVVSETRLEVAYLLKLERAVVYSSFWRKIDVENGCELPAGLHVHMLEGTVVLGKVLRLKPDATLMHLAMQ